MWMDVFLKDYKSYKECSHLNQIYLPGNLVFLGKTPI